MTVKITGKLLDGMGNCVHNGALLQQKSADGLYNPPAHSVIYTNGNASPVLACEVDIDVNAPITRYFW